MKKKRPQPQPKRPVDKKGKRVAKAKRPATKKPEWIGRLNGKFRIVGDIVSPAVPAEDWEYDERNLMTEKERAAKSVRPTRSQS